MPLLLMTDRLPEPADAERAEQGLARWNDLAGEQEGTLAASMAEMVESPDSRALLLALFGNSPWLTHCSLSQPETLCQIVLDSPERVLAEALEAVRRRGEREAVMAGMRKARMAMALATGIADIAGQWDVTKVTAALSAFADAAVASALDCLFREAAARGEITLSDENDPLARSGLFILGLGKLGGLELNYSSDIDLMALYDAERLIYTGRQSPQQFFVRCIRDMVGILESRTRDGFVFRTDLRLRPDPGSTPVAVSVEAAELYYESTGQNWERAALIKARVIAGDPDSGAAFLRLLEPFLWRKNLDFAAIEDIHSIKRQIHAARGGHTIAIPGHNLKLGRGGIREIEFFAQTQQLIWGGRVPSLRVRSTTEALAALAAEGRITEAARDDLTACYRTLRRAEHRLQMIEDRQTHSLPSDPRELERFAIFSGHPDAKALSAEILDTLRQVERHYADLFEESPSLSGPGNLVFTGSEDDPDTLETLAAMGFGDGPGLSERIRGWHRGRIRATRSSRARELLTELVPALLESLARTANPDAAFRNLDAFLARLPAGVQLFSLFIANPGLLDLVAEIMGSAPRLAAHLAAHPSLLDAVLAGDFYGEIDDRETLTRQLEHQLAQARDFEDVLDRSRRFTGDHRFQIGMQILKSQLSTEAAGQAMTELAEVVLDALFRRVGAALQERHGKVPGRGMAIVALGKLGGGELSDGSDLDLLFIYENGGESSDGAKPLAASQYFARLSQQLITALSAPTAEGILYEVDMRLRPSGNAGPIATSLEAFTLYQKDQAWTWEQMALTRARVIAGDPGLGETITDEIKAILTRRRDDSLLRNDVLNMRARLARGHPPSSSWDVKYRNGGLIDVEFIAQYLQLRHAHDTPSILCGATIGALEGLAEAGLLDRPKADILIEAARFWRSIQAILRFAVEGAFEADASSAGLKAILVRTIGADSFEELERRRDSLSREVRAIFVEILGDPEQATGG